MEFKNAVTGFILAFFIPLFLNYFLASSHFYFTASFPFLTFLFQVASLLLAIGVFYYYAVEKYWITDSKTIMLSSIGFLLMGISTVPYGLKYLGLFSYDLNIAGHYYLLTTLVASILIVSCAFFKDGVSKRAKERMLATFVMLAIAYLVLLTVAIIFFSSMLPPVFGPNEENLPFRAYLSQAIILFLAFTSVYFARVFTESKNEVMFWFSVGLALLIMSEITWSVFKLQADDVFTWLGCVYRLAAFVALLIGMKQVYIE
ncbi:hypothetical protein HY992_01570 [Candidatus Micrarchaeota archaeon]|nr:hypothetical protein [Candidatus Micrarchaeota archaeon]